MTQVLENPINEKSNRTESDSDQKEIHKEVSVKTESNKTLKIQENSTLCIEQANLSSKCYYQTYYRRIWKEGRGVVRRRAGENLESPI